MASSSGPLVISSLSGGLNDAVSPLALANDACTIAENVEFFATPMGERRLGCEAIDLPSFITANSSLETIGWMGTHYPSNTVGEVELWALAMNLTSTVYQLARRTATAWAAVTAPSDPILIQNAWGNQLSGVSLHGKFFLGYKSAADLLHVWDGTTLRRAGLTAPVAPTGADTAAGGSFSGTRYYRVREVVLSGSTVLLRSEPGPTLTQAPGGSKTGITVTKPATINSNATHWELEASLDNGNFYRVARTVVGTTTVDDTVAFATGYAVAGVISEDLTAYTQIPSGRYLTIDADRLIIGGSWENPAYASRIWWTPVLANTGVGNDERLDMTVNPYIDLDNYQGGEITGLSRAINGYLYAFKRSHIYKIVRTGNRESAYSAIPITTARGAIHGSLVEAVDENGFPALYFLDPVVGPMRIGNEGLQWCGENIRGLWTRVNPIAPVPAHGVFYQAKNQIHFWISVDGSSYPNMKIVLHCDETRSSTDGTHRGWVTVPVGDRIAAAHCSQMFSSNIDSTDARNQTLVPLIGKEQWTVGASTIKDLIQQCDTGTTDAYTTGDTDAYYYGVVQTKPFSPTSILQNHGVMAGALIASANTAPANDVYVKAIRDFGLETLTRSVSTAPESTEEVVILPLDSFNFSELKVLQLAFGDLDTDIHPAVSWELHTFLAKIRPEQTT